MKAHGKVVGVIGLSLVAILDIAGQVDTVKRILPQWVNTVTSGPWVVAILVCIGIFLLVTHGEKDKPEQDLPVSQTNRNRNESSGNATGGSAIGIGSLAIYGTPPSQEHRNPPKEEPRHNVQFTGVRQILTDGEREVFEKEGATIGVKACFLNKPIAGAHVGNFRSARARVVFRDASANEVLHVDRPKWLDHDTAQTIRIDANHPECILLAIYDPTKKKWLAPYLRGRDATRWEGGGIAWEIDGQELPTKVILAAEITLVGENNLGLEPVSPCFYLGSLGEVEIKPP